MNYGLKEIRSRGSGLRARALPFIIRNSINICLFLAPTLAYAQKTIYFTKSAITTNVWKLSETSPAGPADSTSSASNGSNTTGWYHVDPGLSDNSADASEPSHTSPHATLWVSENTYNGIFDSGNWVFTLRKTDNKSGRVGKAHVNLYRSSSQTDQTSATFIVDCTDSNDDWTGGAASITVTCAPGATVTLTNEYLVVHIFNQVTTGGSGSGTWSLAVEDTTNGLSRFTTPSFTPTTPARNRVIISGLGTRDSEFGKGRSAGGGDFAELKRLTTARFALIPNPESRVPNFQFRISSF